MGEAVTQLREAFGDLVPENANDLNGLPRTFDVKEAVCAALRSAQEEVTPEQLRSIIKEKAAPALARKGAELALGQAFQNLNFEADAAVRYTSLVARYPGLKAELDVCLDRTAVNNVLGVWRNEIEGYAVHFKAMVDGKNAAVDHAIQSLADRYGVSAEAMGRTLKISDLESSLDVLKPEIGTPEEEIRQAYVSKAERFVEKKTALLNTVDQLPVTQALKAFWKNEVLTDASLNSADVFTKAEAVASRVPADKIAGIEELFSVGKPDADTVYVALQSLSLALNEALLDMHGGVVGGYKLGGDGQGFARFHTAKVLLDRMPALQTALENSPALLNELHSKAGDDMVSSAELVRTAAAQSNFLITALQTRSVDNAKLVASIGDLGTMPVPFLAALNQADAAVRANFADMDLPDDLLSFEPGVGSRVNTALCEAISKAEAPLTPAQFSELAQKIMNSAVANSVLMTRVHEIAAEGQPLGRFQDSWVARALIRRHPELNDVFAAGDAATVRGALGELDAELVALVRVRKDFSAAWTAGEDYIYRRMNEVTGVSQKELREILSLRGVTAGGSFAYKQADILEELENPNTPLQNFPDREALVREFESIGERFVTRKGALYQSVDDFTGLSPEGAVELKRNVLTDSVLKMPDFLTRCSDAAKFIAAEPLREILRGPATTANVLELLRQMAEQYDAASHVFFPPEILSDMGSDETGAILRYTLQIFFARNPDLKGTLLPELADEAEDIMSQESMRLSDSLSDIKLTPEERAVILPQYVKGLTVMALLTDMRAQG